MLQMQRDFVRIGSRSQHASTLGGFGSPEKPTGIIGTLFKLALFTLSIK
jgi:hypothetical protein